MKDVVVSEFLSVDGVMQAPGGPQEDTEGGFRLGGWQMGYFDDAAGRILMESFQATDALLLGRRTYEIFAGYWPTAPVTEEPLASQLNRMPKYVWSTTLDRVEWNNSRLMKGDMTDEVNALKQQPGSGHLAVIGSGRLAQSLMQRGLVDAYELMVHPLVLGTGKRLFADVTGPLKLKLVDVKTTGSGIVFLSYRPEGK
jgi:dihydrofolate reductase